jgi:ABC-type dipeptide/oligopeptide/nickel transport system ATPase component
MPCSKSKSASIPDLRKAVDGISLSLDEGEVLGIVGESGSGKSVTMMALMGLVAYPGRVKADKLMLRRPRPARCRKASATSSSARTWR